MPDDTDTRQNEHAHHARDTDATPTVTDADATPGGIGSGALSVLGLLGRPSDRDRARAARADRAEADVEPASRQRPASVHHLPTAKGASRSRDARPPNGTPIPPASRNPRP